MWGKEKEMQKEVLGDSEWGCVCHLGNGNQSRLGECPRRKEGERRVGMKPGAVPLQLELSG